MGDGGRGFAIEYEPRLVEEAVLLAVRGRTEEQEFRRRRDPLYEIPDQDERETGFRALHAEWFERLGLDRPVCAALMEEPLIVGNTSRCVLAAAFAGKDEGADLFVSSSETGGRSVGIRVSPGRLTDKDRLLPFLRHELLHVADMLDPRFEYTPWLPESEDSPAHERLLRDRYRVLWGIYAEGRLARRDRAHAGIRARCLADFARAFPMLGDRQEEAFDRFFEGRGLTHPELAAFAKDPERAVGRDRAGPHPGERCPLCGFPTYAFLPEPERLPQEVRERIRARSPGWDPVDGLCLQCADLYRSSVREVTR